ncbi:cytochrome c550 [Psychrobacillus sp. FSL W7-1457]|uniref:cytochrome c550 n=1 Tax=unclassified Psychrobacillus TaxID=2636677 RepID=UPI0030F7E1C4
MQKNPIIPFILIMAFGIGLIFFLSIDGVGNKAEIAESHEGGESAEGGEEATAGEFDPEALAQGKCISCHGNTYEGGMGPSLVGLELSEDEIKDILANGKGSMMPGGLVPEENLDEMAAWVKSLGE